MSAGTTSERRRFAVYLFLVTSSMGFLQPFLPLYMDSAGLSKAQIGIAAGLGAAFALLFQPLMGRLSDRVDSRRPFVCGAALAAGCAYLAFPSAKSFPGFIALSAVGANGTMYLTAAGGVLVGRYAQSGGGAAYAGLRVWGSVGYILTSLLTGWLLVRAGGSVISKATLDPVFHVGPLLFFAIAALAWWLPDAKSPPTDDPAPSSAPLSPNLRRFLVAYFLYSMALYGATAFLSLYMKTLGATPLWITASFASGVLVEVLVMRWSGRFSDQYGRRPALVVSFLLLPIRLLLYIPATGPLWVLFVQSLHGVNFGIVGAVAIVFANDLSSHRTRGQSQARLAAAAGLASAIGPLMFGAAANHWGLRAMFGAAALVGVGGAAVLLLGVEDSHSDSQSIAERAPHRFRKVLRWLDAPPGSRRP